MQEDFLPVFMVTIIIRLDAAMTYDKHYVSYYLNRRKFILCRQSLQAILTKMNTTTRREICDLC